MELTLDTEFVEKIFEGQQSERLVWSHDDVLNGKADGPITSEFSGNVLGELLDAIAAYRAGTLKPLPPPVLKKKTRKPTLDQWIRLYSPPKAKTPSRKKP